MDTSTYSLLSLNEQTKIQNKNRRNETTQEDLPDVSRTLNEINETDRGVIPSQGFWLSTTMQALSRISLLYFYVF